MLGGGTKLSSPRRYIASVLSALAAFVRSLTAFCKLWVLGSVDEDCCSSWDEYCRKDKDLVKSMNFASRRRNIEDEVVSERAWECDNEESIWRASSTKN